VNDRFVEGNGQLGYTRRDLVRVLTSLAGACISNCV